MSGGESHKREGLAVGVCEDAVLKLDLLAIAQREQGSIGGRHAAAAVVDAERDTEPLLAERPRDVGSEEAADLLSEGRVWIVDRQPPLAVLVNLRCLAAQKCNAERQIFAECPPEDLLLLGLGEPRRVNTPNGWIRHHTPLSKELNWSHYATSF